jgi:hypothetical protein
MPDYYKYLDVQVYIVYVWLQGNKDIYMEPNFMDIL